ncbi:MAG: hypothetical protein JWP08_1412 [Bryobacterales bacterium]|nr:hypothetical protein [Bryobacterales bacterium]
MGKRRVTSIGSKLSNYKCTAVPEPSYFALDSFLFSATSCPESEEDPPIVGA